MSQVDFGYIDEDESTIYLKLLTKQEAECSKLVSKTESVFEFLVEQGNKIGFNVDSILERPNSIGQTCFSIASKYSEKICDFIIGRQILVNSLSVDMTVPEFRFPDLAIRMMEKGINPFLIDFTKNCQINYHPNTFESDKVKPSLSKFSTEFSTKLRSVHFTIEDITCQPTCPADCSSNYKKFFYKNGPLVRMTDENRIGSGGFSMVFRELFHGIPMAMKCIYVDKIEFGKSVSETKTNLEENISEIRIQIATRGSGVIVPVAFVRQQDQEQDENGKWIAMNYNIFIYPLYNCNLYEFHGNHYKQFTEKILTDIMRQCLTRKGSNKLH